MFLEKTQRLHGAGGTQRLREKGTGSEIKKQRPRKGTDSEIKKQRPRERGRQNGDQGDGSRLEREDETQREANKTLRIRNRHRGRDRAE